MASELAEFRAETREWLQDACPQNVRSAAADVYAGGSKAPQSADRQRWFDAAFERGYTVPAWPKSYGGADLDQLHLRILREEMAQVGAPVPLGGMGVSMIGPTLLEHGNDDQKQRHLPAIASGERRWCQGYSEPGAGSDLAGLQTKAADHGDYYLVNGSKIWTSGANFADWIFCLVRTKPDAPKHEGISFLLFPMNDPGVTVKPIKLISGQSPFCECFFDDVKVPKTDLVGQENRGWTIAKRLLQHERSSISGLAGASAGSAPRTRGVANPLQELAADYVGLEPGVERIADFETREKITRIHMDGRAFALTQRRTVEETRGGTPTFATSMFKYYGSELGKRRQELTISMMGTRGVGAGGDVFESLETEATRGWLRGKAGTIAGGTSEVQLNIIAKRVLGLPD